ncbi:MAG: 1-acyl-sn-glycerol-3-phosphate acyltransferase [Candidatus Rokubacteria bacterium]|nr:1-acyl-sn-glycerol-3-phosphate acyltransferase [Candidatus Rokubacteria bacterium]
MRTPIIDLFRPWFHAFCRFYFGLELRGVHNIPSTGPVIIVPNHQTYADPPLVTIPVRRRVFYMAWNRLFDIPAFGWFISRLRAFPVDIEARDARATREVIRLLKAGEAVMIFPEGERSPDGRVSGFKPGAFRLAASLRVPVLPVTIAGGHEAWPPGRVVPRRGHVTITYHPVVRPEPTVHPRDAALRLADDTRAAILSALTVQSGGPDMAPRPPDAPSAPAKPWRSSTPGQPSP